MKGGKQARGRLLSPPVASPRAHRRKARSKPGPKESEIESDEPRQELLATRGRIPSNNHPAERTAAALRSPEKLVRNSGQRADDLREEMMRM